MSRGALWGVILAGGEGQRLRGFLRSVHGTDRPKQFCAVIGTRSMLRHTVERVNRLIPAERTVTVVTAGHRPFVAEDLVAEAPRSLVEQPANRDTAPGILLPLAAILRRDPTARVAIFPSDHFILEESRFMDWVARAAGAVDRAPHRIALLGIAPDHIASGYGWIEPGPDLWPPGFFAVRRFWEKPDSATVRRLFAAGCLLNTFVVVAAARTLWEVTRRCLPHVVARFEQIARAWESPLRNAVLHEAYAAMAPANFSREVLERMPERLGVLEVRDVLWSDWGEPARVVETVRRIGSQPPWLSRVEHSRPSEGWDGP